MDVQKLVEAIDAQVLRGDIIGAFEAFAADNCVTHSAPDDITRSKSEKLEGLRWFLANIASINNIERPAFKVEGNESHSEFVFDFTNQQGEQLLYNEVIRRVWSDGRLVEEQYLLGQSLPKAKKAKTATGDAAIAPAPAKETVKKVATPKVAAEKKAPADKATTEKKATEKKAPTAKPADKKADDLTIVEGIGPKIAEILNNAGIVSFADLAATKPAAIKTILEGAGKRFQMHDPATWPKQATLARDGKTAELTKLQAELKGGK
jgi:predicted flap endonuclease-1-like 5' DNA nuclease